MIIIYYIIIILGGNSLPNIIQSYHPFSSLIPYQDPSIFSLSTWRKKTVEKEKDNGNKMQRQPISQQSAHPMCIQSAPAVVQLNLIQSHAPVLLRNQRKSIQMLMLLRQPWVTGASTMEGMEGCRQNRKVEAPRFHRSLQRKRRSCLQLFDSVLFQVTFLSSESQLRAA